MAVDLNLMFENAKEYNADESKIFQVVYSLIQPDIVVCSCYCMFIVLFFMSLERHRYAVSDVGKEEGDWSWNG